MAALTELLTAHLGDLPGAVALVARGEQVEAAAVGSADAEGTVPMARDSLFRIASLTKPIVAAATLLLVDDGELSLDDPISRWLPELASPVVVRTPAGPVDDVVPAARPITVADLLTFRCGYGLPADMTLPAVDLLLQVLGHPAASPRAFSPDEWLAALAQVPLLHQPGEAWLYDTGSDIQGVLIARVAGRPLPEFLAERLFEPLGMADTGFTVPIAALGRFTSAYRRGEEGLRLIDSPEGRWSAPPPFPSGAAGLVSTADDLLAFARFLRDEGTAGGHRLLRPESVHRMTTDHLTPAQRAAGRPFLHGQGWGFGGSVDVDAKQPWEVPGRYGWVGGAGTALHLVPATGTVSVLLTQVELTSPEPTPLMKEFWTYAAS
ncbi:beta-lactamase class C [Amycolatopsis mediterranei S699]|uniref:Beta-lactamase class C n=3 Tax=Amycolatopsis mediterranei TaxID=33910 RepID=A0A0H3D1Z3_AMYMU|nr:serine hydrolase [Amycolatopsis mediterranei]ADJ44216.1 beta-lactamase class C [Amycolatopsis mediterranei U32]AEK40952.1 beta-lactamase class C [Amycolatopsis mediterranei S699]AFO75930.1 beta-lactamase class C [Amycolatopsis mediterranei S699]AGT83059.1 beta-lactamase class C [Amycolatopsis mediterranei RB]KDO06867.1 beta-lactamase [Amycolatopsis mediterranei]